MRRVIEGMERWPAMTALALQVGPILFVSGLILFTAAQISIAERNGWWFDELWSLFFSEPSISFTRELPKRLATETNPPLFFVALYWVRNLVANEQTAVVIVNLTSIFLAISVVIFVSLRAGMVGFGLATAAAFILSGAVERYTLEARAYAMAMGIVFIASWLSAFSIAEPQKSLSYKIFLVLGALSSLAHVYAGIFCGGLAAGLLTLAFLMRRHDLAAPALAMGLSAVCLFVLWIILLGGALGSLGWIKFTSQTLFDAAWYVQKLAFGPRPVVVLLAGLLAFGLVRPTSRPLTIAFGVAFGLFVTLPLLASLRQPMIGGRYWLVGAPAFVVLVSFLIRTWWFESATNLWKLGQVTAISGAFFFLAVSSIFGFFAARELTATKPIWRGASIVRPLLRDCPLGSVRVFGDPTFLWGFAKMSLVPVELFVDAARPEVVTISAVEAACRVLGWAEHVQRGYDFVDTATDEALMQLLKIGGPPASVRVRRHGSGFVILRPDA